MYTECPACHRVYRATAEHLRVAGGAVRCTACGTVFNALASLRDTRHAGPAETVGSQLPDDGAQGRVPPPPSRSGRVSAPRAQPPGPAKRRSRPGPVEERARSSLAAGVSVPLPLRNLLRNRRRALLALSAIGFGVVALLLAGGFMEWIAWAMRESTIQSRLGHAQVVRAGYFERGQAESFGYLLPGDGAGMATLAALPGVRTVAPRLAFSGLASFGETTVSFLGEGVDPAREEGLSEFLLIVRGEAMSSDDPKGMVLGQGLAENLGVSVGDTLVLLATTASGGVNAVEGQVRGLFYTSSKEYDDVALRVPLAMARELVRAEGAHAWVVLLEDTGQTDAFVARAQEVLAPSLGGVEVVPWHALADFYNKTVRLFAAQMDVVRLIIGVIIVLSISNVLVMSVLDRTAEIGTLLAVGLRRRTVLRLFLGEGALLGVLGGTLGVAVGYGLAVAISAVGIPMPPPPGMESGYTGRIMVTPALAASVWGLALVTTLLASVYPAWKASRLEIVDALRHSR